MKKQSGLTVVGILIVAGLAVLVIGGAAYFYTTVNVPETPEGDEINEDLTALEMIAEMDAETSSVAESENVSEEIADEGVNDNDWQIYRNEEYGFEVKYPKNLEWGGPNPAEKLLFSLFSSSPDVSFEFWIQNLDGKTLEQVFEEKLELEDISYFDWIRDKGGEVGPENIGGNTWLFVDGSSKSQFNSHYLVPIPNHDAYLILDIVSSLDDELSLARSILETLKFD